MARFEWCLLVFCLLQLARCDDPETERLRNTPPELSSAGSTASTLADDPQAQARFIPFAASFAISAGGNTAQTFSISGTPDGIGISQSASHADGGSAGNPGFSASQSSSLAAGLNGISASDASSVAGNHPIYGPTAQSNGNSFSVGQAAASSHGDVVNGQAISSAQSAVGATNTQAASGAHTIVLRPDRPGWNNAQPNYASGNNGDYYYNRDGKPSLTITVNDNDQRYKTRPGWYENRDSRDEKWRQPDFCKNYSGWYRDPRCRGPSVKITKPGQRPYYENVRDPRQESLRPSIHITTANAGSSAQSGPGGLTISQLPNYENLRDPRQESLRPSIQITTANAGSSAQSGPGGLTISQSAAQSNHGNRGPSLMINRVEASSNAQASSGHKQNKRPGLSSTSASASSNSQASGSNANASAQSSANAGSFVTFPGPSTQAQIIPREFVRSKRPKEGDDPIESLVTDLTDVVYEILDY